MQLTPRERDKLLVSMAAEVARRRLARGVKLNHPEAFSAIVTRDPIMMSIFKYIEVIAASPEPVLLTGETGVGKELIAQAIHKDVIFLLQHCCFGL